MSNTDETERKPPLPRPVGEDGLVPEREPGEAGEDELGTGLADTVGGGRTTTRDFPNP